MRSGPPASRESAQRRVDRIRAFREELAAIEEEGTAVLDEGLKRTIAARHDSLLAEFAARFDVDTSDQLRQLSWGMRIASLLGAAALSAAVFFFFQRIWGTIGTASQILVLAGSPLLALAATGYAARRERTLYFASLLGIIAFACFLLDLGLLGTTFNITPTRNALLVWSAFAFALAYSSGLRLLLAAGIGSALAYLAASVATWGGCVWSDFGDRPENFLLPGLLLFGVGAAGRHGKYEDFPVVYRLLGLLAILIPVFILSNWGAASYFSLDGKAIEIVYQVAGFLLSGLSIWIGVRRGWAEAANVGSVFFVLFLLAKFFDWWWDVLPRYLFFLVVGLLAVGLIVVLKKVRGLRRREAA